MLNKSLPNILTSTRIILIPIFVLVFYLPVFYAHFIAGFIFFLACCTDWLDGHLARKWQITTAFGAFLDPVADKLLIAVALVLIVAEGPKYLAFPAAVIICREIMISALREWMAELGKRASVAVSNLGKIKTGVQMAALIGLIIRMPQGDTFWPFTWMQMEWFAILANILLYFAAVLTLWSMAIYSMAAWRELREKKY